MTTLFLVVLVVIALGVLVRLFGLTSKSSSEDGTAFPYQCRATLFSPAERSFLGVLDQALGQQYRVFGKVRVADVATVRGAPNRSNWQRDFNRISAKHFDFVLCNPADLSFVCVIELDDKSHAQEKRQGRDRFIDGICAALGLPLLRLPAKRGYTVEGIRADLAKALQSAASSSIETSPAVRSEAAGLKKGSERAG